MKQRLRVPAFILLLFNGTGAIYGGYNLISFPDGSSLQISLDWLQHTPFSDFFIPGLILLWANGVFSFVALAGLIFRYRHYALLVMGQGLVLTGWIGIQILMLRTINILHIIFGTVGLLLVMLGRELLKGTKET